MTVYLNGNLYDTLYEAMVNLRLTLPITSIWSNADEIDFDEEYFRGVYTATITFSQTDIVKYEWVYANRCEYEQKVLLLKPSKFPDARIMDYLNNMNNHLTLVGPRISWSYEEFDESKYPVKEYPPTSQKHGIMNEQPYISVKVNGTPLLDNEESRKYLWLDKKELKLFSIDWDKMVEDKFMGRIIRSCISSLGEKYWEVYTIKKVIGTMIQCEEYDIPKIHYEDEPIYYEEYKDRNVCLNTIVDWTFYAEYSTQ